MNLSNNKILITGGGSGIGLGLAERFLLENNAVIICGRREPVLKAVAEKHPSIITRTCDLSSASQRTALYDWIMREHSDLNILVNNAGIQQRMSFSDPAFASRAQEEIIINIEAPVHLTSLFMGMPSLAAIINISSGLAYVPMLRAPVYSATKAFLHSFTLSLRRHLQSRGIEVIEVLPPALNTDLGGTGMHAGDPPVEGFIEAVFTQLKEGKTVITYGFTEAMVKAGAERIGTSAGPVIMEEYLAQR